MKRGIFLIGIFVFLSIFLISFTNALTPINSCSTLSTANEIYVLQNNISFNSSTCFNITADNITLDGNGHTINGIISTYSRTHGISAFGRNNLTIKNFKNITNFFNGIYFISTNNSLIINNIVSSNAWDGISLVSSSNNTLINITTKKNSGSDFHIIPSSEVDCNNNFINIIVSGNKPVEYYNYSVTIKNKDLSELILCNADNSTINNITIKGSDTKKNNGLLLFYTDNAHISNINSSKNVIGISLDSSSNNTLSNITANSNRFGIYLISSSNNNITNSEVNSNRFGIYLGSSSNNILSNSHIENNTRYGIYFYNSSKNTLYDDILNNTINYKNQQSKGKTYLIWLLVLIIVIIILIISIVIYKKIRIF